MLLPQFVKTSPAPQSTHCQVRAFILTGYLLVRVIFAEETAHLGELFVIFFPRTSGLAQSVISVDKYLVGSSNLHGEAVH